VPQKNHCHDNVAYWVKRNPKHKHVFGFLIFDLRIEDARIQVVAHSVVEDESGALFDITPQHAEVPRHKFFFLRYDGSDDDFKVIARDHLIPVYIPMSLTEDI
jgi:hypothetical protein